MSIFLTLMKCFLTTLLLTAVFIARAQTISNDSLVLLLPFNGNARDESGNNYHGVVNGAALTTGINNQPDGAYYFNGISNSVVIPNITKLDRGLAAFTILIRLQPQDVYKDPAVLPPFGASYNFLTWHRNKADSTNAFLHSKLRTGWQPPATGTLPSSAFLGYVMEWCNISGTASSYQKDTSEVNNQWHTVAYVYNAGTMRIYHNCNIENNWNVYPAWSEICGIEPVQISLGNVPQDVMQYGYKYFKGKIDELRIYTRALSETEVKSFASNLCTTPQVFKPVINTKKNECFPNQFSFSDETDTTGLNIVRRKWSISNGDTSNAAFFNHTFTAPGSYTIKLQLYTATGLFTKDTLVSVSSIGAKKFLLPVITDQTICSGQSVQPQLSGASQYQWQPCTYLSNCTTATPVITPEKSMTYRIISTLR